MNLIATAGSVIGGVGLLLVGMAMMTDGLKLAAGNALRNILATWTNTRARGLTAGFLITGLVQSSSAVTVATIGFANAGLLGLGNSVWVIYGSNVGTTMTGWIVALIGFKLKVEAFALPMVGLGVILRLTGEATRRAFIGQALIGFGLLFLGIGVLADTFANLGESAALPVITEPWLWSVVVYIALGVLLTTLMQSSSAALVIALSAAEGGLIPLNTAALVVIGRKPRHHHHGAAVGLGRHFHGQAGGVQPRNLQPADGRGGHGHRHAAAGAGRSLPLFTESAALAGDHAGVVSHIV